MDPDSVVVVGAALRDMRKFYERVDLEELRLRFIQTNFPEVLARVLNNLWRGPRAVRMGQRLDPRKLHARSGLPAGSGFSDIAVIAYTVQGYDAWAI